MIKRKASKPQTIYLCTKHQKRKTYCPPLKIFNHNELKDGLNHRYEIPNHGLSVLFLKLNTCLQFYNHLSQPEGVEGVQAGCQS